MSSLLEIEAKSSLGNIPTDVLETLVETYLENNQKEAVVYCSIISILYDNNSVAMMVEILKKIASSPREIRSILEPCISKRDMYSDMHGYIYETNADIYNQFRGHKDISLELLIDLWEMSYENNKDNLGFFEDYYTTSSLTENYFSIGLNSKQSTELITILDQIPPIGDITARKLFKIENIKPYSIVSVRFYGGIGYIDCHSNNDQIRYDRDDTKDGIYIVIYQFF